MTTGDRFLNVQEVAERLNVSRASIFSWAKAGKFPRQKKFGIMTSRWSAAEVEEWIAAQPTGAYGEAKP